MHDDHIAIAIRAAKAAGTLLRDEFHNVRAVNAEEAHDIKLELDVRSQAMITDIILGAFPGHAIVGEEGAAGAAGSDHEWIVDPIDGTVNYFYGIPHFCISIALRDQGDVVCGVIYDPMRDEIWRAVKGGGTFLNDRPCKVSARAKLADAILTVGFSKTKTTIEAGLPVFEKMVQKVRKCRMMGSAALDLAYVSCGRLDAYIEASVSLWDIAAGKLLVECAGGKVEVRDAGMPGKLSVVGSSGNLDLG